MKRTKRTTESKAPAKTPVKKTSVTRKASSLRSRPASKVALRVPSSKVTPPVISESKRFGRTSSIALASAMFLSIAFLLGTRYTLAQTNPPLANPPSGNVYPTFTNLETKTDLVVGQNLKVGNSIKPKTGGNLTLDADKVNIKKDFEALGNGLVGALTSKNSITSSIFNLAKFNPDGSVSMNYGGLTYSSGPGKPDALTLKGPGAVYIQGIKITPEVNNVSTISGNNLELDFTKVTALKDLAANYVGTKTVGTDNLSVANKAIIKDLVANDIVSNGGITSVGGITSNGNLSVSGDLSASKHLSAGSIGSYYFTNDKPKSVLKGGTSMSDAYCPDAKHKMTSCSLQYFGPGGAPMPTPDIYKGKAHIGNSYIDRVTDPKGIHFCRGEVWNQYDVSISYRLQATCFDSSK